MWAEREESNFLAPIDRRRTLLPHPPFGSYENIDKGRPMFESRGSHPYQYDKSYQFRQAEARRNCKDIFQRRGLTTSGGSPNNEDMSLTSLFSKGQTEVMVPHEHLELARCASAPSILASDSKNKVSSDKIMMSGSSDKCPTGGLYMRPGSTPASRRVRHELPTWHTHGVSTEAHVPGYYGHIPGFRTQSSTVGCRFTSGTQALRDLSKPGGQAPVEPPPRFEGLSPRSRTCSGSFTNCTPWIGTLRGSPTSNNKTMRRTAADRSNVMTITA